MKTDPKKVSEILRKREVTTTEKKFIGDTLKYLGGQKKPLLTLPKGKKGGKNG